MALALLAEPVGAARGPVDQLDPMAPQLVAQAIGGGVIPGGFGTAALFDQFLDPFVARTNIVAFSVDGSHGLGIQAEHAGQLHQQPPAPLKLGISDADVVAAAMIRLGDDLAAADIAISGHFIAEIRVIPGDRLAHEPGQMVEIVRQPLRIEALVLRD